MNKDISNEFRLRGEVTIYRQNVETGETELWFKDHNTFVISGMQWILMKMFNLHLDSIHDPNSSYENIGQDTNVVVPDLNEDGQLRIGRDPHGDDNTGYTVMGEDIPSNHFIQGFIVGNGGSGEDVITTKNTDYSFINLRNPIPFQQSSAGESLDPSLAGKYLGVYRQTGSADKSYYIKKFDDRPHIYHSWWRDGQRWDYVDPVTQADLGPNSQSSPKTNRIETYASIQMSVDTTNGDCLGYFKHAGQTAMINELGLVAFDTIPGERSLIELMYERKIKRLLTLIFDNNNRGESVDSEVISLATDIFTVLDTVDTTSQTNLNEFKSTMMALSSQEVGSIEYEQYQENLTAVDTNQNPINIGVEAFYNQNGVFVYTTDKFLQYLSDSSFANMSTDEAQRIKLVTYYTFNAIPLQANWKVLINYRVYAN